MKLLKLSNNKFYEELKKFLSTRSESDNENIQNSVKKIIEEVKKNGDNALCRYTSEFDGLNLKNNDFY